MSIPDQFRKAPKRAPKEHELRSDQVPYAVREALWMARTSSNGSSLYFHDGASEAVEAVLRYLGGVPNGRNSWMFDYNVGGAIDEIMRTGLIPEQKSHQFFWTQRPLADEVIKLADISAGDRVLEPNAGRGDLVVSLPVEQVTCVDVSPLHCKVLEGKGYRTSCADFLNWHPGETFSRIVMNPPFSDGRALAHVKHALTLLDDDGILVAVLPGSLYGKEIEFGWNAEWIGTRPGMFADTKVTVALVRLTRKA